MLTRGSKRHGRRPGLLLWIYLYTFLTVAVVVAVLVLGLHLLFGPPRHLLPMVRMFVDSVGGSCQAGPQAFREAVKLKAEEFHFDVAFFRRSGEVLAANSGSTLEPLEDADHKRLAEEGYLFRKFPLQVVLAAPRSCAPAAYVVLASSDLGKRVLYLPIVLAVLLLVLAVASMLLSRSLVKPIREMVAAVEAFGDGDLSSRVVLRRGDELGSLGLAYNEMADRIAWLIQGQKELLANVSHELRNPLARVRVALDIADLDESGEPADRFREILADLDELQQLLDDIIYAARLDVDSSAVGDSPLPLRMSQVSFEVVIQKAAGRFAALYPGRELRVQADIQSSPLRGDVRLLRRVVDNLLDNAARYSDHGTPVSLRVRFQGGTLEVEVADQGAGIAEPDLARVFEPFFRAERSRGRATGGTGLGLTLARSIVEAHGGTIGIESTLGKGTIVRFTVPARDGKPD